MVKMMKNFRLMIYIPLIFLLLIGEILFSSYLIQLDNDMLLEESGKKQFEKYGCFVCHGNEGIGGVRNKNLVTSERIPSLTYVSRGFDNASLKQRILRGSTVVKKLNPRGPTPPVAMPPFGELIDETELEELVVYLQSLAPEEDEEPRQISPDRPPVPDFMLSRDNCGLCHGIVLEQFKRNLHYASFITGNVAADSIVCLNCHGNGREHAEKYGEPLAITQFIKDAPTPIEQKNRACLQCHERGRQMYWENSIHETNSLACVDCHQIMEPKLVQNLLSKNNEVEVCVECHQQRRAQIYRSSRMPIREGKVNCSHCHNSHGSSNEKLLLRATVNENCFQCHAEKRGPFLWEHPPVVENCLNCHQPHGSHQDKLLTFPVPRLCQQCHIGGEEHSTTPQLATSRYVFNRSCVNCHSQIHGSNNPSGVRFHR